MLPMQKEMTWNGHLSHCEGNVCTMNERKLKPNAAALARLA